MVAQLDGAMPEWVWYRTSVYDAAFRLRSNGKAFVLMRFGTTLSWQGDEKQDWDAYTVNKENVKLRLRLLLFPPRSRRCVYRSSWRDARSTFTSLLRIRWLGCS